MHENLNLGNSLFKGLNDKHGLVICGYEYGESKADAKYEQQAATDEVQANPKDLQFTFANKTPFLGEKALKVPYDNRIIKWFELWGHRMDRDGLGDDFTKSIMQTNLSNTQANRVEDYEEIAAGIDGFVEFLQALEPSVILFMGSKNSDFINRAENLPKIEAVLGKQLGERVVETAETSGAKFRVIFQDFEHCRTVTLPHPSGSVGLSDEYIAKFAPRIGEILREYKTKRGF
ncbi:hypothetical protein LU293_00540 [Moraxella nasovis]|uniref:hypothetical protein n=1 Tax=Moraxella nasovis TaxID=2904121 RepID=UPI001F6157C4|nr:hypothetical protein [Moraxella nasovis]UNU73439.1 hypothetical protein LU293_00540 [Moraxella nasovis]